MFNVLYNVYVKELFLDIFFLFSATWHSSGCQVVRDLTV